MAEGSAAQAGCPMVHNNGTNGQSEVDGAAPNSNSGTGPSRIVNQAVHNSGSEKLGVEVTSENKQVDSRTAAAGAAVRTPSAAAVVSGNEEPESPEAGLCRQAKAAEREEREAAAALAHKSDPVPEKKLCQCGDEISFEKATSRDECRNCYFARLRREGERRKAEVEEHKRVGFLEVRDRGRPKRGLFNRVKTTVPLPSGGAFAGPLSDTRVHASGGG